MRTFHSYHQINEQPYFLVSSRIPPAQENAWFSISAKNVEKELLYEISRIRSSTTIEGLEKSKEKAAAEQQRRVAEKIYNIECDINGWVILRTITCYE